MNECNHFRKLDALIDHGHSYNHNVSVGASNEPKFQVSDCSKSSCFRQVILLLDVYDVIERDCL